MGKKATSIGKYGNPQLNIRLDESIMEQIETKASEEGVGKQEWVKRLILQALGEKLPTVIARSEFEMVTEQLAKLAKEVESLKELENGV